MPTAVGPNTFGEENLVFGYDTGDTVNSYRGEPTTNIVAGTNAIYTVAGTYTTNTTVDGVRVLENDQVNNSHVMWNGATGFIVTCSAGAYITVSAEYKTNCTVRMRFRDNPYDSQFDIDGGNIATISTQDVDINTNGEWKRYSLTAQTSTANPDLWWYLVDYRNNNEFGRVEIRNWQIEVKSHATPFVNGTRSATQGLIDLTGNSTIDLSNVSFDSNAQMTFDGTSDYVDLGSPSVLDLSTVTQEVVYQPLGINRRNPIIGDNNPTGSDSAHAMWLEHYHNNKLILIFGDGSTYGDVFSTATITDTTKYHHIVCVRDASAKTVEYFINGSSDGVKDWANKSTIGTPIVYDGSFNNNNYNHYIGASLFSKSYSNIPLAKIYNRALTASEIKANYNAIKGRFNI